MKKEKETKEHSEWKWFIEVFIITFVLSMIFSYISENGVSTLESFPRTITDLLKEDIHLQHWIQITKKTFKEIAEFSCEAAKECNRYYYLIMHVLPPEVITEFKKAVKK